jgi:hypothetical protein
MRSVTPGRPGRQHAGAAHDEVDLGTGLAGLHQRPDEGRIGERVDLDDDARRLPAAPRPATSSSAIMRRCNAKRRRHQWRGGGTRVWLASCWKTASASAVSCRVGGEHAHVGVQPRRPRVVVAGGQVGIAAQPRHPSRRVTSSSLAWVFRPTMP